MRASFAACWAASRAGAWGVPAGRAAGLRVLPRSAGLPSAPRANIRRRPAPFPASTRTPTPSASGGIPSCAFSVLPPAELSLPGGVGGLAAGSRGLHHHEQGNGGHRAPVCAAWLGQHR